jgi:hypothetical protein
LFVLSAGSAFAGPCSNVVNADDGVCTKNITVDSGVGRWCSNAAACTCSGVYGAGGACPTSVGSSCPRYYTLASFTMEGYRCCISVDDPDCSILPKNSQLTEEIVSSSNELSGVFAPQKPNVDYFFGYYGNSNRSPNTGRANSIMARLDVCMGDGDATNAVATMNANTCYNSYCGSGTINEYCNASVNNGGTVETAGVCHDRCECAINGIAHSTCNQL